MNIEVIMADGSETPPEVRKAVEGRIARQCAQAGPDATFDRFDVCEAHYALEVDYNKGGWLHERLSNKRRREATHVQLHRMGFKPSHSVREHGFDGLSENGQAIYRLLERRYGFHLWNV